MSPTQLRPPSPGDHRCQRCGTTVREPVFFDTRHRVYCSPECWECDDGTPRWQASAEAA
jgi:hypothetical protein